MGFLFSHLNMHSYLFPQMAKIHKHYEWTDLYSEGFKGQPLESVLFGLVSGRGGKKARGKGQSWRRSSWFQILFVCKVLSPTQRV